MEPARLALLGVLLLTEPGQVALSEVPLPTELVLVLLAEVLNQVPGDMRFVPGVFVLVTV